MKLFIVIILAIFSLPALAKEYVIAVSPHQDSAKIKRQMMQSLKFATDLKGGDRVNFFNGYHIEPLGTFDIPENEAYASEKARMKVNQAAVAGILKFAVNPPKATPAPTIDAAVRIPHLLRYIGQNYAGKEKVEVIILGSPFYDDPADANFSMAGGLIPGDGHLQVTREKSPYGIVGNQDALKNVRIHWAYGEKTVFPSDRHAFLIERFWQFFVSQQGGEWVTFDGTLETAFSRAKGNAPPLSNPHTLQKTDRLEMIRLKEVEVKTSIHERPLSSAPPTAEQLRRAENVEVAITWDCQSCDLDLYVRPMPSSPVIYFGHIKSDAGIYYKDFRSSPMTNGGFETVEMTVPVDLRALVIAVNFFDGQTDKGVSGILRLAIGDETYAMPFKIMARQGNGGEDVRQIIASNNSSTPETLLINPLAIVGG